MKRKDPFSGGFLTAGISGALAVSLGALGAHALKARLADGAISPDQLNGFDTAVKYHMYHTLAMVLVLLMRHHRDHRLLRAANLLFMCGIVLFSGSLYLLCTRGITGMEGLKFLGPVTPLGGLCFVAGWLCLGLSAITKKS